MKKLTAITILLILFMPCTFACKQTPYMGSLTDLEAFAKFLAIEDKPRLLANPPIRVPAKPFVK